MALFSYQGRDKQGRAVDGQLEAASEMAAADQLMRRGIMPTGLRAGKPPRQGIAWRDLLESRVGLEELVIFTRQMYALTKAGIPIMRAIHGLSESAHGKPLRRALQWLGTELGSGRPLSAAMQAYPKVFNSLFVAIIHVGENTGQLDGAFKQLSSYLELERETDPHCQELQRDYIQFVQNLSSREAVSRRFFLIFEYEPFNANRKEEEREILAALETASQTAKTFLYQCGNEVVSHDNEDEFTTDVLYTLLNRTLCTEVPLSNRISTVLSAYTKENRMEELDHIRINEFLAPESVDFKHSHYVQINGLYHSYLLVPSDGYKNRVTPGWLSLLVNAGEGIDIDFFLQKQPKDKIQQRLGQQIRINRSKLKDASDTNTDYDDLDSAIRSGYFLKQGLANNEDFYYMNLLITITASTLEELQWRIQEMKKPLTALAVRGF